MSKLHKQLVISTTALLLSLSVLSTPAQAQFSQNMSKASGALSGIPVALSVVGTAASLVGGASLVVVAVEELSEGVRYVFESAVDGSKVVVEFSKQGVQSFSAGVGETFYVISSASGYYIVTSQNQVRGFIPSEQGAVLFFDKKITN